MDTRKVEAKSQPKILEKSEATWEISGWTGPLSEFMLSEAECFVNLPTANIQLRFHFAPYKSHLEDNLKFCSTFKKLYHRSRGCCGTCIPGWLTVPSSSYPEEVLPKNTPRSAGYSLLVDVLNAPTEKLAIKIYVDKLNGDNFHGHNNNLVILNTNSERKDIPVVKNFWRTVMWNMDESGNVINFEQTLHDTVDDARIRLTVAAYQMESTGTDAPPAEKLSAMETASEKSIPAAEEGTASNPAQPAGNQNPVNEFQPSPQTQDLNTMYYVPSKQAFRTQHNPPTISMPWGYGQTIPFEPETQKQPDGKTNKANGQERKSLCPKPSTLNELHPTNAVTGPQTDSYVYPELSAKLKNTKMADEPLAAPSLASSDAGSDFDFIESPDKQKNVVHATNNEEVRQMQEDVQNLLERLNRLRNSD